MLQILVHATVPEHHSLTLILLSQQSGAARCHADPVKAYGSSQVHSSCLKCM